MLYFIDTFAKTERITAYSRECEHCEMFPYGECTDSTCPNHAEYESTVIYEGELGSILAMLWDVHFDFLNNMIDSFEKYFIENTCGYRLNFKVKETDVCKLADAWFERAYNSFGIKLNARITNELLEEVGLVFHWFNLYRMQSETVRHALDEEKRYSFSYTKNCVALKNIISFLAERDYKKGMFKFFCLKNLQRCGNFNRYLPEDDIEKQTEIILDILWSQDVSFDELEKIYEGMKLKTKESLLTFNLDSATPIFDIFVISANYLLENEYTFKKCANCKKVFVPLHRSDAIYCNRKSPQDEEKTCKEYGAYKQYQENLKNNASKKLYRQIYQQRQMRVKRNPDIKEYKTSFENFKYEATQWKRKLVLGEKTERQYLRWLETQRTKKV